MDVNFSEERYEEMIAGLFVRFPSFQKTGAGAYKPGIANMQFFDQIAGHPHRQYRIIHVAGTNGKGSVSNMLASVLTAAGYKVGLYTSPHILDFRERMRVAGGMSPEGSDKSAAMVSKEYVWEFIHRWQETFDHLDMSFFEITTVMALNWFAEMKVDWVVLETGLGGRLDSTNIVTPDLSVITNIGLDHCDLLGYTLPEIAFEKAGIIKPKVPVIVGESNPETDQVFERKVLYTNISEPEFMGSRAQIMSLLTFADKTVPELWDRHEDILLRMDMQGTYQKKNLRTVLAAVDALCRSGKLQRPENEAVIEAIAYTASRMGFHGRWEKISDSPVTICDIGHNAHGLAYNFTRLAEMKSNGECSGLIIVYGSVADKDVDSVIHLMPEDATYIFTQASGKRALAAERIQEKHQEFCAMTGRDPGKTFCVKSVADAVALAGSLAEKEEKSHPGATPLIYIGGSTYVVSEALASLPSQSS